MKIIVARKRYMMWNKIRKWFKSAAGIISIFLLIISIVLIIIACSPWGHFTERTANNINNILFGVATNLLGIIVTVSFVQFFIDKQNYVVEKKDELKAILKYNKVLSIFIEQYTLYYRCITTPDSEDKSTEYKLNIDFSFEDMCDMYSPNVYLHEKMFEPAISLFYKCESHIREYMMTILQNIQFKYYNEIRQILEQFIRESFLLDVRENIMGNMNMMVEKEKLVDIIHKEMKDTTQDWVKIISKNKHANVMAPYVQLYLLLKEEAELLIKYEKEIHKLILEENR